MPLFDFGPAGIRAVQNAIKAAWPEAAVNGVWEVLEAKRVAVDSLKLPRAHYQLMVAEPWEHSPMTQIVYEQPVIAYYLGQTDGGSSEFFRTKALTLQARIMAHGLKDDGPGGTGASFTWLPTRFRTHCYDGDQVQQMFLTRNNYQQAGALAFAFLCGDDGQ